MVKGSHKSSNSPMPIYLDRKQGKAQWSLKLVTMASRIRTAATSTESRKRLKFPPAAVVSMHM